MIRKPENGYYIGDLLVDKRHTNVRDHFIAYATKKDRITCLYYWYGILNMTHVLWEIYV